MRGSHDQGHPYQESISRSIILAVYASPMDRARVFQNTKTIGPGVIGASPVPAG
jgi:hypothetical protein